MDYKHIKQVALLASSSCNLKCSYCYLHDQHQGDAYSLLNKEIQQAWKDGSYVNNIKKVFELLSCSPNTVTDLSFWGGEPLISLTNMLPSIKDLFKFFKNLTFCMIPTNWTIIKDLVPMLFLIDEAYEEIDKQEQMVFHLQMSIDGPPGPLNDSGHPGKWDQYYKNIEQFIIQLKEKPLQRIRVQFEVHPTATKDNIFNNLNTPDKIQEYEKYMQNFLEFIDNTSKVNNTFAYCEAGRPLLFPVVAVPDTYTSQDGIELSKILQLTNITQYSEIGYKEFSEHMYFHSLHNYGTHFITEANPVCTESGLDGLTILYDGTICDCPCSYIHTFTPYLEQIKNDPQRIEDYKTAILRRMYFFNPITATEKEKEYFNWYMLQGVRNTKTTQVSLAMALCQELALSGQINYAYLMNPELLLKGLYSAGNIYSCPREQIVATKNSYLTDRYQCKKYFNGAMQNIISDRQHDGKYVIERTNKWNQEFRKKTLN